MIRDEHYPARGVQRRRDRDPDHDHGVGAEVPQGTATAPIMGLQQDRLIPDLSYVLL